jgi:hypothetical protein
MDIGERREIDPYCFCQRWLSCGHGDFKTMPSMTENRCLRASAPFRKPRKTFTRTKCTLTVHQCEFSWACLQESMPKQLAEDSW